MNDALRNKIARAIMEALDRASKLPGGCDYDPDACHEAADKVCAVLLSELLDVDVEARHHPSIIGPARFYAKTSAGEVLIPLSDNYF